MSTVGGVGSAGAAQIQAQTQAQTQSQQKKQTESPTIYEMMRDAREKAQATRDKFQSLKSKNTRYGDAPIEAYSRLARAKSPAQVNAAAGYARRQISRLKAAKRQDPDNSRRIQAAINQLQKAVHRAGKKNQELNKEKIAEARQKKLREEKRSREANRQRQELRRKQTMRMLREGGYIREAEIDNRMQSHISAVQMELREQAQALSASIQPSVEAAVQQYAAAADIGAGGDVVGGEISLDA